MITSLGVTFKVRSARVKNRRAALASRRGETSTSITVEDLTHRRLTAGCFAGNLASVRILEKVGMRREQHGVADSWHAELGWVDGYTYGLLAETWRRETNKP